MAHPGHRAALTAVTCLLLGGCTASFKGTVPTTALDAATQGRATLSLVASEHALLQQLFGTTLDRKPIRLVYDAPVAIGSTRTIRNVIYFPRDRDITDPKVRGSAEFLILLAHESTHVWQYQNVGLLYIADSLYHQAKGYVEHRDRRRAYRYTLDSSRKLTSYNSEQQGEIVEDYVALKLFNRSAGNCENCASLGRDGALERFEELIRRDINVGFSGLTVSP